MAKIPPPDAAAAQSQTRGTKFMWWAIIIGGMMMASLSSMMILLFGMLPTLVAYIIDRSPRNYAMYCVGGMNLSGVFPYLLELWTGNHDIDAAIEILTNPASLLVMYAAAGFGWMLFMAIPPLVGAVMTVMSERRLTYLHDKQKDIVKEWGEDVGIPDEDEVEDE